MTGAMYRLRSRLEWNHLIRLAEGRQQCSLNTLRCPGFLHARGERAQAQRQSTLIGKARGAAVASLRVGQSACALCRLQHEPAGQIINGSFKFLTIHAKHLAVLNSPESASGSFLFSFSVRSLSISIARALCSRERTVPTAQESAAAAST